MLLIVAEFAPMYSIANIIGLVLLGIATLLTLYSGIECIVKNKTVLKD